MSYRFKGFPESEYGFYWDRKMLFDKQLPVFSVFSTTKFSRLRNKPVNILVNNCKEKLNLQQRRGSYQRNAISDIKEGSSDSRAVLLVFWMHKSLSRTAGFRKALIKPKEIPIIKVMLRISKLLLTYTKVIPCN